MNQFICFVWHSASYEYVADWYLDPRFDRDSVTVGSTFYNMETGKEMGQIAHNKGWSRYEIISEKTYGAKFQIRWSKSGQFFAEIEKDQVKIYEINPSTLSYQLVRKRSKNELIITFSKTLNIYSSPETKFERELAEYWLTE